MWPDSPLFRGIHQRIIPQPKAGPTMDAWKARIPQDLEELNAPHKYKLPSQMNRDELVDMASDLAMPMAGTVGKTAKWFHGTPREFDGPLRRDMGNNTADAFDRIGVWLSNRADDSGARMYGKNVLEVDVAAKKPLELDGSFTGEGPDLNPFNDLRDMWDMYHKKRTVPPTAKEAYKSSQGKRGDVEGFRRHLMDDGTDAIVLKGWKGDGGEGQDAMVLLDEVLARITGRAP